MRAMADALFDGLSELIYVSDPVTYELLYLNQEGRAIYGEHAAGCGRCCYDVLQGLDAPCEFCTNPKLSEDSFYEWEFTNKVTKSHYLLRDKLVLWDDKPARLEIAFDMTSRQLEKQALRFMVDASTTIVECIRILESDADLDAAFDDTLRKLGEFFEADRSYVFEIEGDRMFNTREWCADGILPQMEFLQDMPLSLIDHWMEAFDAGDAVLIDDIANLPDQDRGDEYEVLARQDIRSLVAVPLEENGRLVGYIGVDNPTRGERLDVVKTPLLGLAHFVTSRIKRDEAQRKMAELTWNDSLTGLLSRAAFHRDYDQGTFECIGFALVDADRLSDINRERGREAGDGVLRRIAETMAGAFDRVYRIGDDEFCAVVEDIDYASFSEASTELSLRLAENELPASVGAAWQSVCNSTEALLDMVGDRMRRAKRGRHRAVEMGIDLASDAAVSSLLQSGGAELAVETGMFDIYLMPQSSSLTGEIVGAEALIRYIDDDRGCVALPTSFVLALEDMGEISSIDFFALSRACETLVRWREEGRGVVPISVNFSRLTVSEDGFVKRVAETVGRFGLDPSLIEVEITESARERSNVLLHQVSASLRALGFRVAIDDFGVDNANFSLFVQLSFDVLKLDKTLVWGLGNDDRSLKVVKGLVNLCDDLGIESVAEGIENDQQLDALRAVGCTRAQGYLIGRPMPIASFERDFL